jgi:ribosomal protein S16
MNKVNSIREFIRERGSVSKKEIIRFLMVDLRGVDGKHFDANYPSYSGQSATNFVRWKRNGHLVSIKGMYSLTESGKTTTVSMYKPIPKSKDDIIAELKEDIQYWINQNNDSNEQIHKLKNQLWVKEREITVIKNTISDFKGLLSEI